MKLLIVDDSVVFRSQIKSAVEELFSNDQIATASNGKIALQKLAQDKFDVMTLDLEMPELNGIETLREIRALGYPVKTVIFSGQTTKGASLALEALKLGAIEVVSKPDGTSSNLEAALDSIKAQLIPIIKSLESSKSQVSDLKLPPPSAPENTQPKSMFPQITPTQYSKVNPDTFHPKIVVIGSSTGGPSALEMIFEMISPPVTVPIMIVQHMPPVFTASLAARLGKLSGIEAAEGRNGEVIKPGKIYVAPGDYHMGLFLAAGGISIKLSQGQKRCNVRPAVDVLFEDVAGIYEKTVAAMILTGMGEDGMLGCRAIKSKGGCVAIQDKETCVVWGMPGAVHASGAFDKMAPLAECGRLLQTWTKR